jgi:hypothetical protein
MSEDGEDIWQGFQEDHIAGDRKANSQVYDWAAESEWLDIVEWSANFEVKEWTADKVRNEIHTLAGNRSRRLVLRREQLDRNQRENQTTKKEGETNSKDHNYNPRKIRNDSCL